MTPALNDQKLRLTRALERKDLPDGTRLLKQTQRGEYLALTAQQEGILTERDYDNYFSLLMIAGNETTRHTISHGMHALMENPDQLRLLQEDMKRPWSLKQRILGRHGHLSNDAAAEVAAQLASGPLEEIHLGHLSRECNRPELALKTVTKRLSAIGATRIRVFNTSQDEPSKTVVLDPSPQNDSPDPTTTTVPLG